jgi:hypothetical protein
MRENKSRTSSSSISSPNHFRAVRTRDNLIWCHVSGCRFSWMDAIRLINVRYTYARNRSRVRYTPDFKKLQHERIRSGEGCGSIGEKKLLTRLKQARTPRKTAKRKTETSNGTGPRRTEKTHFTCSNIFGSLGSSFGICMPASVS